MNSDAIQAKIAADAAALGVRPGDTLLVHSSLKSLGDRQIGPGEAVGGLLRALGPEGTLLLPALSYLFVGPDRPFFDELATPSCVGAIPEWFRTQPGVRRSLCPTHSCAALGPRAGELTEGHLLDGTPCGPHSPFAKLREAGGKVLFLGCGTNCNTSMHACEERILPPYLFKGSVTYRIRDREGRELTHTLRAHDFAGVAQRYSRVPALMDRGVSAGRILRAECVLLEAVPMWDAALRALRRDPYALVERVGPA